MQQLRILKGMVAVFVFCQCFTIVADVYELICTIGMSGPERTRCPYNIHIENLINIAHFMLSINSSMFYAPPEAFKFSQKCPERATA